jgi:hypothetical protein
MPEMSEDELAIQAGQWIRQRRKELRLSQDEIRALGGPSTATLRVLETGKARDPQVGTTWTLERILGWRPGAIRSAITQGRRPEIAQDVDYMALRKQIQTGEPIDLSSVPTDELLAEIGRRAAPVDPGPSQEAFGLVARRRTGPSERDAAAGPQEGA